MCSIPRASGGNTTKSKPWWNNECSEVRRGKRSAWNKYRRAYTFEKLCKFKKERTRARRAMRRAKLMFRETKAFVNYSSDAGTMKFRNKKEYDKSIKWL